MLNTLRRVFPFVTATSFGDCHAYLFGTFVIGEGLMIRRLSVLFVMMLLGLSVLINPSNAQTYKIDINDADASVTEAGWTALNALHTGSGSIVTIDGIPFEIFSADGARVRGGVATPNPNALTGDFVFDDGAGQAVGMYFGGAGDLPLGFYQVDVYIYDAGAVILDQIVGWRRDGVENVVGSNFLPDATNPSATFEFYCDGIGRYDLFVRENNTGDRTRLNAVALTYLRVPEPGSAALLLGVAAVGAFALRRTRRA
jgi:hypothetical protein